MNKRDARRWAPGYGEADVRLNSRGCGPGSTHGGALAAGACNDEMNVPPGNIHDVRFFRFCSVWGDDRQVLIVGL